MVAKLKPKLKAQKREEAQPNRYDIDLLRKDGEERDDFRLECRNRFLALEVRDEERNVMAKPQHQFLEVNMVFDTINSSKKKLRS